MSAHNPGLALDIDRAVRQVDPSKVSNSKWNPIRDLVAEALLVDPDDVYATTISKPGNISVRVSQSSGARDASMLVLIYTGNDAELERCVAAVVKHCADRRMSTIFVDGPSGWTLAAIVKQRAHAVPTVVAAAYPAASVLPV